MILGTVVIYALFAGLFAWLVELVCNRLGAPGWLTRILYGAALVYFFWFLQASGLVRIGQ